MRRGTSGTSWPATRVAAPVFAQRRLHAAHRIEPEGGAARQHQRVDLLHGHFRLEQGRVAQARRAAGMAMEAAPGASKITAVTPEASAGSWAEPTFSPGISVMRLRKANPAPLKRFINLAYKLSVESVIAPILA